MNKKNKAGTHRSSAFPTFVGRKLLHKRNAGFQCYTANTGQPEIPVA